VLEGFARQENLMGPEIMRQLERGLLLQIVDQRWKEHLYDMDKLKEGIGLRAYGQRDPLLEYKREGFEMFAAMILRIKQEVIQFLLKVQAVSQQSQPFGRRSSSPSRWQESRPEFVAPSSTAPPEPAAVPAGVFPGMPPSGPRDMTQAVPTGGPARTEPVRRQQPKIGRNDPCPCGSGKKYKKCHGANQ